VVTQPERRAGRGRKLTPTAISQAARAMGIDVVAPARMKDPALHDRIRACGATFFFVTAYGRILPPEILGIPPMGCVNLHASLLPRHRGAAPVQWAIISGDAETGLSLMKMDEGMDTGPVIAAVKIPIGEADTAQDLFCKLEDATEPFVGRELSRYLRGDIAPSSQDDDMATLAPPLAKVDGIIDWTRPAREVSCRIRGVTPWPGARTFVGAGAVCIIEVRLPDPTEPTLPDGLPGMAFTDSGRLRVVCGAGWLEILRLKPPGKRAMDAADFLRGRDLGPCCTFGSRPTG
jgi:methionyl-tRNA formyltransferase